MAWAVAVASRDPLAHQRPRSNAPAAHRNRRSTGSGAPYSAARATGRARRPLRGSLPRMIASGCTAWATRASEAHHRGDAEYAGEGRGHPQAAPPPPAAARAGSLLPASVRRRATADPKSDSGPPRTPSARAPPDQEHRRPAVKVRTAMAPPALATASEISSWLAPRVSSAASVVDDPRVVKLRFEGVAARLAPSRRRA